MANNRVNLTVRSAAELRGKVIGAAGYPKRYAKKLKKVIIMKDEIGRNDLCPCGSGKKYKKCCQEKTPASLPTYSWMEKDGFHSLIPGTTLSSEQLENMTKVYQKNIRNSPIWDEMVKQYGKEKAEKLLKEFRVKIE